ncbi:MAG: hypothetical protein ACI4F5_01010 [Acutalibacteraceae bacterium]
MKKQIIVSLFAVLIILTACFAGGKYYMFRSESNEKILSLELPPFSDDIVLHEGETVYEQYFEVIFENGFSSKDITFVSEDESVASAKYSLTDRNRYVCYKVKANSVGETYIYFTANDGETVSEKVKVVVLPKITEPITAEATDFSAEPTTDIPYEEDETETTDKQTEVQPTAHTEYVSEESTAEKTTEKQTEVKTTAHTEYVSEESTAEKTTEKQTEAKTTAHTEYVSEESTAEKTAEKATEPQGDTVYIAPTGKRYHYSKTCAGKNASAVSKAEAQERGRTPCKKCAGG